METQSLAPQPSVAATALRYGVLTGVLSIAYSFILLVTKQIGNAWLGWGSFLILALGIVLAERNFRQQHAGFMTYGEGLGIGALLSVVSGVLNAGFSAVYRLLDPSIVEQATEQMRRRLEDAGNMSDEQIDRAIAMGTKFSNGPIGFVLGVVSVVFIGTILSLIISAFLKNPKPEFE